ncbi:hypothetical protein Lser_V15G40641 [Lactuca serriola]
MANLKFADMHNLAIVLADPPTVHSDLRSMIHMLRECFLASAITVNPIVYQNLIREFWATTSTSMDNDSHFTVKAMVQGRDIVINESFIRDTLLIDDQPNFPTEIGIEDTQRILRRMSNEGTSPLILKKLLHPNWRFFVHKFVSCVSGRRSGADEISQRTTGALVSLAAGVRFHFSRFILDEFFINIKASTQDTFVLYPRFIQLFINTQFPEVRKEGETLDMKSLGPHTMGLLKQNRKGKVVFQGLYPLEKFGKFIELDEPTESYGSSEQTSSEPVSTEKSSPNNLVIDISEDESTKKVDTPTPHAQVVVEHDRVSDRTQDDYLGMNVEFGENSGGDKNDSFSDLDLSDFDHDDIVASLASSANLVSHVNLDTLFNNVNDVVPPTTEIRGTNEVFDIETPTSGQMANVSIPVEMVMGCSPPVSVFPTTEPFVSVFTMTQSDQPPSKRLRRDLRQTELVASLVCGLLTPPTTTATTSLTTTKMFPTGSSTTFNVGGPSVPPGFTTPRFNCDDASERLALRTAEEQLLTSNPRGKGVSIGGGGSRGDNLTLSGL